MAGNAEHTNTGFEIPADELGGAFPPFDHTTYPSQILWLVITFALFYWIMKNVAVPRIAGILEDRKDRIAGDISEANRLKQETDEAIAAYEQALAEARAKAHGLVEDTRDKLKAEQEARRERAETDLSAKLAEAEAQIEKVKTGALTQVSAIASETTSTLVEALIGKAPADKDLTDAVKSVMN
ncbi:F0F1 ATP synthase subunit B [Roseibium sp. RKSG952]|uniref:F0F1 ATP synthase subunit B n=1 Tax=Roseibium sp. RKSG952 TaxID=2529384 RepID=UPI0012BC2902|nr:F0F1 ATP synthase subunit B [Roseibium sp. RKSG952]MTH96021.1 F0F1 ATP synthase subunit B [Roseibium sp. RKSG952]